MNYKYNTMSCFEAAEKLIDEEYESNRLQDLVRVKQLQTAIQAYNPGISNLLLMALVNILFKSREE